MGTTLNQVLSGLHNTDVKLKNKLQATNDAIGLSSIQTVSGNVVPILNDEQRIDPRYNSLTVSDISGAGTDQLSNIQFIGNCAVRKSADGSLIIRIGDNLNSSTFNTKDGQTDGTASLKRSPSNTLHSVILNGASSSTTNVVKKGTGMYATIETAGKIHFDDNKSSKITVKLVNAGGEPVTYEFGPITGNGNYTATGKTGVTLTIANWAQEAKTAEGATGYEGKPSIKIEPDVLTLSAGEIKARVETSGTAGAATYPATTGMYETVCYYVTDTTTKPAISDVMLTIPAINSSTTVTYAGVTSFKAGDCTYSANISDLKNPATNKSNGSEVSFTNSIGFCDNIATYVETSAGGLISKISKNWKTNRYSFHGNEISCTATNLNGATTVTHGVIRMSGDATNSNLGDLSGNADGIDVYTGTPHASMTGNRRKLDATTEMFDKAANLGNSDLMLYHGELQYPINGITNKFIGCSSYVQPTLTGDKSALFYFSASGTEKNGTLTINGSNLTHAAVKEVKLGNSPSNLLDITSTSGIGTSASTGANQLKYTYVFKTEGDYIDSSTGCWVKITFSDAAGTAGAGPRIKSIER